MTTAARLKKEWRLALALALASMVVTGGLSYLYRARVDVDRPTEGIVPYAIDHPVTSSTVIGFPLSAYRTYEGGFAGKTDVFDPMAIVLDLLFHLIIGCALVAFIKRARPTAPAVGKPGWGRRIAGAVIVIIALAAAAAYMATRPPSNRADVPYVAPRPSDVTRRAPAEGPLSYAPTDDIVVHVERLKGSDLFLHPESIRASAESCGSARPAEYYDDLVSKLNGADVYIYDFKRPGDDLGVGGWRLQLISNAPGYPDTARYLQDSCGLSDPAPLRLQNGWLLSAFRCATADCEAIRADVEPTLQFASP